MGIPSSAGPQQPDRARRSIRATFTATVAVPVACLVLLCATAAGMEALSLLNAHGLSIALNTARSAVEVKDYCEAYSLAGGVAEQPLRLANIAATS